MDNTYLLVLMLLIILIDILIIFILMVDSEALGSEAWFYLCRVVFD